MSGDIERVLIVDDEEPVRAMIARMVTTGGERECETAADAAEARVLLAREGFSVVICDVQHAGRIRYRPDPLDPRAPLPTWPC